MGYIHGKGLGKNQQGIVTPVGAKKRMGKGTIGYYGSEAPAQQPKEFEVNRKKDDADDAEVETVGSQWKKGQVSQQQIAKCCVAVSNTNVLLERNHLFSRIPLYMDLTIEKYSIVSCEKHAFH